MAKSVKFNTKKEAEEKETQAVKESVAAANTPETQEVPAPAPESANMKRIDNLTIKYGANQIYAVDKLPKPGFLYEYLDQPVYVAYVDDGSVKQVMLSSIKKDDTTNALTPRLCLKCYDYESKEVNLTVDVVGSGIEDSVKKAVRVFPPSYAQFVSETTVFHKDTLKRAWEKCKQISKADFKSYSSDSGTALLNTTDNVGMIVKLAEDDYLWIKITRVIWNSKEKTFSIYHGAEEMEFFSFPGYEFDFKKDEYDFTNVRFKIGGLMGKNSPIYKFEGMKCKIIDLGDLCK